MGASTVGLWEQAVKLLQDGTKDLASCSDPSLCTRADALVTKLQDLAPSPKATLKKLVQQLQVPLHVGVAVSAAAQHSCKSPGTNAALSVLATLLNTAHLSGLVKDGAAAGNLAISMRQQLQQAGVLQHLTTVMAAMAADLDSQATELTAQYEDCELGSGLEPPVLGNISELCCTLQRQAAVMECLRRLLLGLRQLWSSPGQTSFASCHAWLCDPSIRHAQASMQLCTAALHHTSTILQYVIPSLEERAPRHTAALRSTCSTCSLLQALQDSTAAAMAFSESLAVMFSEADQYTTAALGAQARQRAQQELRQVLQSRHYLRSMATSLVLKSAWFSMTCSQQATTGSQGAGGSSTGGAAFPADRSSNMGGSSSTGGGSGRRGHDCSTTQHGRHGGTSSSDRRDAVGSEPSTPCQQELFELLCLDHQLTAMASQLPHPSDMTPRLATGVHALGIYHWAVLDAVWEDGEAERMRQRVRQRFEQRLLLLLPSALLPLVNSLLSLADGTLADSSPQHNVKFQDNLATVALALSHKTINAASKLSCWLDGGPFCFRRPHPTWVGELLGEVLQLADKLLLQPQARPAAAASGSSQRGSSTSAAPVSAGAASCSDDPVLGRAGCAKEVLLLLARLVHDSGSANPQGQPNSSSNLLAALAVATPPVSPVAERFGEVCAALEAGLRAFTAAKQRGVGCLSLSDTPQINSCIRMLFFEYGSGEGFQSTLTAHVGMHRPATLAQQLRQFYSVLSTVQKLGRSKSGVAQQLCWGQHVANLGCLAAAHAAIKVLQAGEPLSMARLRAEAAATSTAGEQAQPTAAAEVQQRELEYLPSLVILGRCCLAWAEQLHQQSPELLLLLASGVEALPQQCQEEGQQQGGVLAEHSAARVCVPGWRRE